MKKIGYVRVSSKDQNPNRQMDAMKALGIPEKNIYLDKISGKNFERPAYQRMLSKLKDGDLVVILSIDRLGRNYNEILEQWRILTREKRVDVEVIDMPLLNTNTTKEGLTGVFVSDLVLQILAYVAETERAFIRQRQAEGIAAAKRRGVHFGVCKGEIPEKLEECYQRWQKGELTIREGASELGLSKSTFYRRCLELRSRGDGD
ncbi:MAG: recombinase family protein [Lachnospiraceae bacterium]|jgi:DNA invertase Pin-like site-specific DNA recombinase|nr:recombinase family protein [Lachnospiraceae bacterium]